METYLIQGKGKRENQEDSYYIDPDHRFFMVCDGVGGGEYGRLASHTVIASAKKWIKDFDGNLDKADWGKLALHIHKELKETSEMYSVQSFIGSTAVIVIRWKLGAHVLHVGDSRCYYVASKDLSFWRTKDHSLVQELFDVGVLDSVEEMQKHPKRNVVTRAFSSDQGLSIPIFSHHCIPKLESSDILLLCTDGVQEAFPGDSVVEMFCDKDKSTTQVIQLIENKCQRHARDNFTALTLKIG